MPRQGGDSIFQRIVLDRERGMPHDQTMMIQAGDRVMARNAYGEENERRALTPVIEGEDFAVVWVCTDDEWERARFEGRAPEGVPFPAEDVRALAAH